MEWEPTQMESQQKQQTQAKAVPASRSLNTTSKVPVNVISTYGLLSDLGLDQLQNPQTD